MDYQERDRKKSVLLSCILQLILPWERNVRKQESTGMLCTSDKSVSVLEGLEINFFSPSSHHWNEVPTTEGKPSKRE